MTTAHRQAEVSAGSCNGAFGARGRIKRPAEGSNSGRMKRRNWPQSPAENISETTAVVGEMALVYAFLEILSLLNNELISWQLIKLSIEEASSNSARE